MEKENKIEKNIFSKYENVLLHIAWLIVPNHDENSASDRYLIFGMVEFYPKEIEPIPIEEQYKKFGGRYIYYQRIRLDVSQALQLYDDATAKGYVDMFWDNAENGDKKRVKHILCNDLKPVKEWPNFVVTEKHNEKNGADNPFIADVWGHVRTHQLMPEKLNDDLIDYILHEKVGLWLEQAMGWNISYYPELVGSMVMLLPNPYFSNVNTRIVPVKPTENIKIYFTSRHDADLSKLKIVVFEKGFFGVSGGQEYHVKDNCCVIPSIGKEIDETGFYVLDEYGNLIDFRYFTGFIRKIVFDLNIGSRIRSIKSPTDGTIDEVRSFNKADEVIIGEDGFPLGRRLGEVEIARVRKHAVNEQGFKLFYDKHEEAKEYIKKLIGHAHRSLIIVDPYAATNELFSYVMTVPSNNVNVSIYTSKIYLREKSKLSCYADCGAEAPTLGEELFRCAEDYKAKFKVPVNIYVMTGDSPAVHDRFLIVDDVAWFCGCSLNEIGNRLSCIMKLPDSKELLQALDDIKDSKRVKTIDEWIKTKDQGENEKGKEQQE